MAEPPLDVLSGNELLALLSDEQLLKELLKDAACACGSPSALLRGCPVIRRRAFKRRGTPLYSFAQIHAVSYEKRASGVGECWKLVLAEPSGEVLEAATWVSYISNVQRNLPLPPNGSWPTGQPSSPLMAKLRTDALATRLRDAAVPGLLYAAYAPPPALDFCAVHCN